MPTASTSSVTSQIPGPGRSRRGLLFDGRIAEDFKLATGTWVNRPCAARRWLEPYATSSFAGADRNEIGALIFPNLDACRTLAAGAAEVAADARVLAEFRADTAFARTSTRSSTRVGRAILLAEPPSLDAGEMTDKGSINQRAVLTAAPISWPSFTPPSRRRGCW